MLSAARSTVPTSLDSFLPRATSREAGFEKEGAGNENLLAYELDIAYVEV